MASSPSPDYRAMSRRRPLQQPKRKHLAFEGRLFLLSLLCAAPGLVAFGAVLWIAPWGTGTKISLLALVVMFVLLLVAVLHERVVHPIRTLSNVVSALREEDYSFRARGAQEDDALGELALEVNALADLLADQRTRTIEATALLRRVVEEIDVPIFAFDPGNVLKLVNSAGERFLQKPASELLGRPVGEIGLSAGFAAEDDAQVVFPQAPNSRWLIRRSQFRQGGIPHTLMVLSDVSRALRSEERSAWQKLIRVLGHELNNSLAPIRSIAGSLSTRLNSTPISGEDRQDFARGLEIIQSRSESLNRFLQAYRQLARMPQPSLRPINLRDLIERVAGLENRVHVHVVGGPEMTIALDPDQIEQMMINLIKNAADAALDRSDLERDSAICPPVTIGWSSLGSLVSIEIKDRGAGLINPDNLFVPFYTTKEQGTGIGLILSRQIAEAHGGSIQLSEREDGPGCVATILLRFKP